MELIRSIRRGSVWLNVFMDELGEEYISFSKISKAIDEDGLHLGTVFRADHDDILDILEVFSEFVHYKFAMEAAEV